MSVRTLWQVLFRANFVITSSNLAICCQKCELVHTFFGTARQFFC